MKSLKGQGTAIGWTHGPGFKGETWNAVVGCAFCSEGCRFCYAAQLAATRLAHMDRYAGLATIHDDGHPEFTGEVRCLPEMLDVPLKWKRPRMVFVNSMSDLFIDEIPLEFLARMWDVMVRCPQHVFQILTKRPQRIAKALGPNGIDFYAVEKPVPCPQPNIWLGASIEDDRYSFRANHLRNGPAAIRFLSCEPLLAPLPSLDLTDIDWVLIGGESGTKARPMDAEWAMGLIERCAAEGVACYMKQAGTVLAKEWGMSDRSGTNADEMPPEFRVRQWPITTIPEGHLF